jgi:VWFA-related protein
MPSRPACLVTVLALTATLTAQTPPQPPQAGQVFRAGTTVVPLDVRVVDRTGKPVTDLREDEFIVTENGVRQRVQHFFTQQFTPMAAAATSDATEVLKVRTEASTGLEPQNRRVFVIVLGGGMLQGPAKGLDGALHFVRERLLPQDVVAAIAWNRATDFTTNHARIAEFLERFKKGHQGIEARLNLAMGGLASIYGSKAIPPPLQKEIDAMFGEASSTLGGRTIPNEDRLRDDRDRTISDLREGARTDPANYNELQLDEFLSTHTRSAMDLGRLYAAIDYLRRFDGEKQLVFVSERGITLPRAEQDKDLASAAATARVVMHFIHTEGIGMGGLAFGPNAFSASRKGLAAPPMSAGAVMRTMSWARQTAGQVAQITGGRPSIGRMAKDAFDSIDSSSRFQYLLGYYPTNTALNGRFRQIRITVTRPGVGNIYYRHGYTAAPPETPLDRRQMLTYSRVVSAATYATAVPDIGITGTATASKPPAAAAVQLELTVDPSRIKFASANGRNTAELELLVGCLDGRDNILHQIWKRVELNYTDERLAAIKQSGVPVSVPLPLNGLASAAKNVKVVVYDYAADLVGSAIIKVQ